jgi:predicted ATPase/DNA-binding SARP family transcriptional activator
VVGAGGAGQDRGNQGPGPLGANLLVSLALAPGRARGASALIEDVWAGQPPAGARAALQTLVSRLRKTGLGPDGIVTQAGGYRLAAETDLDRAQNLLAQARSGLGAGRPAAAEAGATQALRLWAGEPGAGASNPELLAQLSQRAAAVAAELRRVRAQALLELGQAEAALAEIGPLRQARPFDDSAVLLELRALAAAGRANEALEHYAAYAAGLADSLGSDPTSELSDYHTDLLRQLAATGEPEPAGRAPAARHDSGPAAATRSADRAPSRPLLLGVRHPLSPLLGRAQDLAGVHALLEGARLVTVLGPGGMGKTRLTQEIAVAAAEAGRSVAVVELGAHRAGEDVAGAIAAVLGEAGGQAGGTGEALPASSADKARQAVGRLDAAGALVVLDNCEHVLQAAARAAQDLLERTARLRVLATSRAPLGVAGEAVWLLEPLGARAADGGPGPGARLFASRARAARAGVELPAEGVERLVERLDGLPLAIELAAARVRSMSLAEIEAALADRFALLRSADSTAPDRHRTLAAVIDWSWDLLTESEHVLARRAAVFPDGFTAEAAAFLDPAGPPDGSGDLAGSGGSAGSAALDGIDALVGQSLLRVEEQGHGLPTRYRMLETVREYALKRLSADDDAAAAERGFLAWASAFASAAAQAMNGTDQGPAFARAVSERETVLAALRLAAPGGRDPRTVAAAFNMLGGLSMSRMDFPRIAPLAELAVDACADFQPADADLGAWEDLAATMAVALTVLLMMDAGEAAERARAKLGWLMDRAGPRLAPSTRLLGEVSLAMGDWDLVEASARAALDSPDGSTSAFAALTLSGVVENNGHLDEAVELALTAHSIAQANGLGSLTALAAYSLAGLFSQSRRPAEAIAWAREAEAGFGQLGGEDATAEVCQMLALGQLGTGALAKARSTFEALLAERAAVDPDIMLFSRIGLAEVERKLGNTEAALAAMRDVATSAELALVFHDNPAPWAVVVEAACLAAHVLEGRGGRADLEPIARKLAADAVDMLDHSPDVPVVGSAALGLGAYLAERGSPDGPELTALAERFASREDLPSLERAAHWERLAARGGADGLHEARARTVDLSLTACLELAKERFAAAVRLGEAA